MNTLVLVEEVLREAAVPLSVREIVERAGLRLPSKSRTPDTVVARDLSMDIKRHAEASRFARTAPGRYTLRSLVVMAPIAVTAPSNGDSDSPTTDLIMSALRDGRSHRDSRPRMLAARPPTSPPAVIASTTGDGTTGDAAHGR